MSRLDDLPPDLRAALSLLVDRGKSYAQVAELLGIPRSVVRDRAHAALDALAGGPGDAGERSREGAAAPGAPSAAQPPPPVPRSETPVRASSSSRTPGVPRTPPALAISRRGGATLLAVIAAVVVVAVVLLTSSGGSSSHRGAQSGTSTGTASTSAHSSSGTTSTSAKTPRITKQLTLTPPEPTSKAIGIVEVLAEGTQRAFFIAAEHLAPSAGFFYAVWLYDSPSKAEAVSKSPTVGSNGRLQGGSLLPANAGEYHQILLTRETSEPPTHPGPVVLSGPFSLGS